MIMSSLGCLFDVLLDEGGSSHSDLFNSVILNDFSCFLVDDDQAGDSYDLELLGKGVQTSILEW